VLVWFWEQISPLLESEGIKLDLAAA